MVSANDVNQCISTNSTADKKRKFKSIRTKLMSSLIIMFIFTIVLNYIVLDNVMLQKAEILQKKIMIKESALVVASLNEDLDSLSKIAGDWAIWDETYRYIRNGNSRYEKANLNEQSFTNLGIDFMIQLDKSGNFMFAKEMDTDYLALQSDSSEFLAILNGLSIVKNTDPAFRAQGIIQINQHPILLASCPILPSSGIGQVYGNLIVGYYLNEKRINKLADMTGLNLQIVSMNHLKQLELQKIEQFRSISTENPLELQVLDDNKVAGYSIINDINNQPALGLIIISDYEVLEITSNAIKLITIMLAVISLIFLFINLLSIHKKILSRMITLSKEISLAGGQDVCFRLLTSEKNHDEITDIANSVNKMLDKIGMNEKEIVAMNTALDKKVKERTAQLSVLNMTLQDEINKRIETEEKIKHIAYHDSLTNLPNQRYLKEQLDRTISLSKRSDKMLAVIFMDLDGFKMINDTMGHLAGDRLLVEIAKKLSVTLGKSHFIARNGGDEFVVLMGNLESKDQIDIVSKKILKMFSEPLIIDGEECFISASMGVSLFPVDGSDVGTLLKHADIAMYKAKENGRNQYIYCTNDMKSNVMRTMKLTNKLHRALENNELEVHYQPQVESNKSSITGFEALLRWNQEEFGMVSPEEFIPIAENTGLIIPIGEWVLGEACKQIKKWHDTGHHHLRVAVNLSVRQLVNRDIIDIIASILNEIGLAPKYLELEITESIAMKETEYIVETLNELKKLGVHLSIDDFGTKYSSYTYLKRLPVDKVKIAMPFIHGINLNTNDEAIIKSLILLGKNIGFSVIAEGVETEKQFGFLREENCDEIQGYYFYKPMPGVEVESLLKSGMKSIEE